MHLVGILNEYNEYSPQQQVPTTFEASEFPVRHSLRAHAVCAKCLLHYSVNSCHHKTHGGDSFCFSSECAMFEDYSLSDDILCRQLHSHAELISKSLDLAGGAVFCQPNCTVPKP